MLDSESKSTEGIDDDGDDLDLISQLADMSIASGTKMVSPEEKLKKSVLHLNNPVFKQDRESSKIIRVVEELSKLKERHEKTGIMEKAVIVSQWTSMLEIVKDHIESIGLRTCEINGVKLTQDTTEMGLYV